MYFLYLRKIGCIVLTKSFSVKRPVYFLSLLGVLDSATVIGTSCFSICPVYILLQSFIPLERLNAQFHLAASHSLFNTVSQIPSSAVHMSPCPQHTYAISKRVLWSNEGIFAAGLLACASRMPACKDAADNSRSAVWSR